MSFKQKFLKAIKIAVLVVGVFAVSLEAPYLHKSYIRSIAEESVVQIFGNEGVGTGSHVELPNGKVVILTNRHVCEMSGRLRVKTESNPLPIERKVIQISQRHDLCVMEAIEGHKGIKLGSEPKLGDELYTLGHPRGEALNVAKGEYFDNVEIKLGQVLLPTEKCDGDVESMDSFFGPVDVCVITRNTIQVSTPTYPGNSGSPIVDKFGHLVAVVFAGNPQIENSGHAVPLLYIKEFLSSLK